MRTPSPRLVGALLFYARFLSTESAAAADDEEKPRFSPEGRVIGRAELGAREVDLVTVDGVQRTTVESLDLLLDSARAGFKYRSPIDGLTLELSVEFAGKIKPKDAFAQYKSDFWGARAGLFKADTSPFEADGRLSLPTADRGFISMILSDRLEIGGRRPGLAAFVFEREGLSPRFTLGAYQGSYLEDEATGDTAFLQAQVLGAQNVVARFELEPEPFQLGAYATTRVGTNELPGPGEEPDHFMAGGADAKLELEFDGSALRSWLDGIVGKAWQTESEQPGRPTFVAARLMGAFRFGGLDKGEFYVEPFAMAGALDPDLRVTSDLAYEAAMGVNAGFWKRGRLTLQGGLQGTLRNFPSDYALAFYRDRRVLLAQAAVEF
jgi:hypothetical protein